MTFGRLRWCHIPIPIYASSRSGHSLMNTSRSEQSPFRAYPPATSNAHLHHLLAALCALLGLPEMVRAHGGWELQVRRIDPSRPDPVVDGVCDPAEYIGSQTPSTTGSGREGSIRRTCNSHPPCARTISGNPNKAQSAASR